MAAEGHILFRCLSATDTQGQFSVLQVSSGLSIDIYTTKLPAYKCFQNQHTACGIRFFSVFRNGEKKCVMLLGFIKLVYDY